MLEGHVFFCVSKSSRLNTSFGSSFANELIGASSGGLKIDGRWVLALGFTPAKPHAQGDSESRAANQNGKRVQHIGRHL